MKAFGDEGEKVKDFKAKLLNDRKKKMKGIGAFGALGKTDGEGDAAGAHAEAKSIATPQEIAQVTLDLADEEMLEQMEEEALERGEDWDSDEEREHLKRLKAEQKKKLMQKMKLGGLKAFGDEGEKVKDMKAKLLKDRKKKMKGIG